MIPWRTDMTIVAAIFVTILPSLLFFAAIPSGQGKNTEQANATRPRFADVTARLGFNYRNVAIELATVADAQEVKPC